MEEERAETRQSKWKTLREKLGFKALACCRGPWAGPSHPNPMGLAEDDYHDDNSSYYSQVSQQHLIPQASARTDLHCPLLHQNPTMPAATPTEEMNLAAALQAERQLRALAAVTANAAGTPTKRSLMRLLEEKEREEREKSRSDGDDSGGCGELGMGQNCCVCMGSKKGAAFIPCGHTFCRVCARELWLGRGACPLCNRPIVEILDIF